MAVVFAENIGARASQIPSGLFAANDGAKVLATTFSDPTRTQTAQTISAPPVNFVNGIDTAKNIR